jgi:hypothetical protein
MSIMAMCIADELPGVVRLEGFGDGVEELEQFGGSVARQIQG